MTRDQNGRRNGRRKDPFAAREAERYENPIASREAILALLNERRELMKFDRIAQTLEIDDDERLDALQRRLRAMVRDGQLIQNRRGGFGVARSLDLEPGRVIGHPDGFGFVAPDGGGDDYYLSPKQMRRVLNGDRVLVGLAGLDRRGRREGQVVEILERGNSHVVGRFFREGGIPFVVPSERRLSQDVLIKPDRVGDATPGDFVYVEIVEQPDYRRQPLGVVLEVLGQSINGPMAAEIAIRQFQLRTAWPDDVRESLQRVPDHLQDADFEGAKDLRKTALVTIDGADARDFDDAVFASRKRGGGWRLIVAIADVSHYVTPGSALDAEAAARGTSVYFPNRVVPMLPEDLSNGICSLKPRVDRRAMACEINYSADAKVQRTRFFEAVIHSHARLTYDQAWKFLSGDGKDDLSPDVAESLRCLYELFGALRKRRDRRGAIDFDSNEVGFRFDADGEVSAIIPRTRNDAHKLIEECMIAANVEAARYLTRERIPAPYRVHAPPPQRKLDGLRESLTGLGIALPADEHIEPATFARILQTASARPDFPLIQALVLRAQSLAVYQIASEGHFGLALDAYAHFTSPIRRYPDLLVHRAIKHRIRRGRVADFPYDAETMQGLAAQSSDAERRAEEASRDVDEQLKCSFLQAHVGDEFDGVVGGVTSFGAFVDLSEVGASGLAHVTTLPNDYYHFDPVRHTLTGERRGFRIRLADPIRVRILRVDPEERQIDLEVVADP